MARKQHKQCTECKEVKPLSAFRRASKNADGYADECKDCKLLRKDAKPPLVTFDEPLPTAPALLDAEVKRWAKLVRGMSGRSARPRGTGKVDRKKDRTREPQDYVATQRAVPTFVMEDDDDEI